MFVTNNKSQLQEIVNKFWLTINVVVGKTSLGVVIDSKSIQNTKATEQLHEIFINIPFINNLTPYLNSNSILNMSNRTKVNMYNLI